MTKVDLFFSDFFLKTFNTSRDEQYVKLQDDYRSLHALLQRVQVEQSEQASIFDTERKKYDNKILEGNLFIISASKNVEILLQKQYTTVV